MFYKLAVEPQPTAISRGHDQVHLSPLLYADLAVLCCRHWVSHRHPASALIAGHLGFLPDSCHPGTDRTYPVPGPGFFSKRKDEMHTKNQIVKSSLDGEKQSTVDLEVQLDK